MTKTKTQEQYDRYEHSLKITIDQFSCCKHPLFNPVYASLVSLRKYCGLKAVGNQGIDRKLKKLITESDEESPVVTYSDVTAGGKHSILTAIGPTKIFICLKVQYAVYCFSKNTNGGKLLSCTTPGRNILAEEFPKVFLNTNPDEFFSSALHYPRVLIGVFTPIAKTEEPSVEIQPAQSL